MSLPIMCLDGQLRQYLEYFLVCFSVPQWRHFATVLLGLMQVEGRSTLSGLARRVVEASSVSSLTMSHSRPRMLSKPRATGTGAVVEMR